MSISRVHHVALRCRDARESFQFYTEILGLELAAAAGGDHVPSTGEFSPHLNVFLRLADNSMLDLIDLPLSGEPENDANTPAWVKHLALEVSSKEAQLAIKTRLEEKGIEVLGPVSHGFCQSIYFFDPSGNRLEIAWNNNLGILKEMTATALENLDAWEKHKRLGWTAVQAQVS